MLRIEGQSRRTQERLKRCCEQVDPGPGRRTSPPLSLAKISNVHQLQAAAVCSIRSWGFMAVLYLLADLRSTWRRRLILGAITSALIDRSTLERLAQRRCGMRCAACSPGPSRYAIHGTHRDDFRGEETRRRAAVTGEVRRSCRTDVLEGTRRSRFAPPNQPPVIARMAGREGRIPRALAPADESPRTRRTRTTTAPHPIGRSQHDGIHSHQHNRPLTPPGPRRTSSAGTRAYLKGLYKPFKVRDVLGPGANQCAALPRRPDRAGRSDGACPQERG